MYKLKETSLEWALLHVLRFADSDFFPRPFEFDAIKHDWDRVKEYLLELDLDDYAPKTPDVHLAQKPNGTFRVVHQLDPLDSLIFTALVHENAELIERFRIPEERTIACSYRISLDTKGSFVEDSKRGYNDFIGKSDQLANDFKGGFVLVTDLVDFYNQIYLHRVNNLLDEAGSTSGKTIESFLSGLNTNVSQGIPVGPYPSILLAELVMADIDKKILAHTESFVRYVDDIYIFLTNADGAYKLLHALTFYLYSNHRLVLSSEKTKVVPVEQFQASYLQNDESEEKKTSPRYAGGIENR
jgi:hypothetical protein